MPAGALSTLPAALTAVVQFVAQVWHRLAMNHLWQTGGQ